jgi:inorganic pyrophosphatase
VHDIDDVPELLRNQIKEFFENYKNLEKGKWVKVESWEGADSARAKIVAAAEAYANSQ